MTQPYNISNTNIYSDLAVANWFIQHAVDEDQPRTQMQIHKLVYFAHVFFLALKKKSPIKVTFKALTYGPVAEYLYEYTKPWGKKPITKPLIETGFTFELKTPKIKKTDTEAIEVLEIVWRSFKEYNASQLSNISYQEGGPWDQVYTPERPGLVIPDDKIYSFYKDRLVSVE